MTKKLFCSGFLAILLLACKPISPPKNEVSRVEATLAVYQGQYAENELFSVQYDITQWQLIQYDTDDVDLKIPVLIHNKFSQCALSLGFLAGGATPLATLRLGNREWRVWQAAENTLAYTTFLTQTNSNQIFALAPFKGYVSTDKNQCQKQAEAILATFTIVDE